MKYLPYLIVLSVCLSGLHAQTRQNNVLNLKKASIDTAAMRKAYIGGTLHNATAADSQLTVALGVHVQGGAKIDGGFTGSSALLKGGTAVPNLTITDTAQNVNTSSPAQAGDTSAFNFSFTGTHKPLFSIIGPTGNPVMAVDSGGRLGIGLLPSQTIHSQCSGSTSTWLNEVYGLSTAIATFTGRQASGTPTSPSATTSSNTLARFSGTGYNGSGFTGTKACIDIAANENWTESANGAVIKFWTTKNGTTGLSEKMRVDDAGNLGIGTTQPHVELDVAKGFAVRDSTANQITSNQNDYSTGTVSALRISSDAARSITGLNNGVQGRYLYLFNIGSFSITLSNQSSSSLAVNRIITGSGSDLAIAADQVALLWYDNTSQRWRRIQ